jgi:hypothetical protein
MNVYRYMWFSQYRLEHTLQCSLLLSSWAVQNVQQRAALLQARNILSRSASGFLITIKISSSAKFVELFFFTQIIKVRQKHL